MERWWQTNIVFRSANTLKTKFEKQRFENESDRLIQNSNFRKLFNEPIMTYKKQIRVCQILCQWKEEIQDEAKSGQNHKFISTTEIAFLHRN